MQRLREADGRCNLRLRQPARGERAVGRAEGAGAPLYVPARAGKRCVARGFGRRAPVGHPIFFARQGSHRPTATCSGIQKRMLGYRINMAKTGSPGAADGLAWPPHTAQHPARLEIAPAFAVVSVHAEAQCGFRGGVKLTWPHLYSAPEQGALFSAPVTKPIPPRSGKAAFPTGLLGYNASAMRVLILHCRAGRADPSILPIRPEPRRVAELCLA